jgi:hypothetical protein
MQLLLPIMCFRGKWLLNCNIKDLVGYYRRATRPKSSGTLCFLTRACQNTFDMGRYISDAEHTFSAVMVSSRVCIRKLVSVLRINRFS